MKTGSRLLSLILLLAVLAGCASQKTAVKSADSKAVESEILYQQALHALDARKFIIEAEEFFLSDSKQVRSFPDSYISMRDNWAISKYSPALFPESDDLNFRYREGTAKITQGQKSRNGDIQFTMEIADNNKSWLNQKIEITLYENTNKCFVKVGNGSDFKFTGHIYPLKD